MGESILGAFLPVLLEKLMHRDIVEYVGRLKGVNKKVLEKWTRTLTTIEAVLNDAEEKQLTHAGVKLWLDDLIDLAYDIEDLLDIFATKMLKRRIARQLGSTSKSWFTSLSKPIFNFSMNLEIKKITARLEEISTREKQFGLKKLGVSTEPWTMPKTAPQLDEAVIGRDEDKKQIVDKLLSKEETCTSNFQVAKEDIVDDTNGSAVSRPSIGSHDYNSYGQTPQATGHNDSNPLLHNIGSDHAVTSNSVSDHAGPYGSRLEQGFSPLSVTDHHGTRVTTSDWIFSATGLGFEAVSACFDQVSSPQKPDYALYGMLLSIVAVLVSTLDLIRNARKHRKLSASNMIWGILPEVFGLALAYIQCISSALQFSFLRRHAENPVKVSLLPFLFFFVLFAFKYRNGRN